MLRRAAILLLVMAVTACAPKPAPLPPTPEQPKALLTGGWWHLVEIRDGKKATRPGDPLRYTLNFNADDSVEMLLDCNKGHGSYRTTGKGELTFGQIAMTKMFCPPPSLSDRIGRDMGNVRSYKIDGNRLTMNLAEGGSYVWEQASLD
jgi:para-nitrobenzyl esterase